MMSKDLGIQQYRGESESHYVCRVLYSGMACWIKTTTFDAALPQSHISYVGVSKNHVHSKCGKILSEFVARFPLASNWFYGNDGSIDPILVIRQRLFGSGDILDIGFQTNIGLVKSSESQLSNQLLQVKGVLLPKDGYYSGVSVVKKQTFTCNLPVTDKYINSQEWLFNFVNRAWWKKGEISDEQIEYFDAQQHSKNNALWKRNQPNYISGLILCRRPINNFSYEYILNKRVAGGVYHHRLDPFLQETREYRRVMFALRTLANNSAPAIAKGNHNNIHLNLRVYLPNREQQLLEAFAWPHNSIEDKLEWDMPYEVWLFINEELQRLGLDVMEDIHG